MQVRVLPGSFYLFRSCRPHYILMACFQKVFKYVENFVDSSLCKCSKHFATVAPERVLRFLNPWFRSFLTKIALCIFFSRAHGVVASHPLRMRKALGSNPSVSMLRESQCAKDMHQQPCLVLPRRACLCCVVEVMVAWGKCWGPLAQLRSQVFLHCGIAPWEKDCLSIS